WACEETCKDNTVLALLLANGAIATSLALESAAENGFMNRCILLLDQGALATIRAFLSAFKEQGRQSAIANLLEEHSTPEILSEAEVLWSSGAYCADDSVLEKLLANGAVATSRALYVAVSKKSTTRCVLLIDHGALVTSGTLLHAWRWREETAILRNFLSNTATWSYLQKQRAFTRSDMANLHSLHVKTTNLCKHPEIHQVSFKLQTKTTKPKREKYSKNLEIFQRKFFEIIYSETSRALF
ncbi:hypothetical protein IFR05_015812, partial [Cadophora sp. M221]